MKYELAKLAEQHGLLALRSKHPAILECISDVEDEESLVNAFHLKMPHLKIHNKTHCKCA